MSANLVVIAAVVGTIALVVLGAVFLIRWIKGMRDGAAEQVRRRLGEGRIRLVDDMANFFGLESDGLARIRGNGCLAATDEQVYFQMWKPSRQIEIPRERIQRVEAAKSHLMKSIGRDLLKIYFENDAGKADSVAWYVRELDTWLDFLDRPTPVQKPDDGVVW